MINVPLHYVLPKAFEERERQAEEIYLLDTLLTDGTNITFQRLPQFCNPNHIIEYQGYYGNLSFYCDSRLDGLRILYNLIVVNKGIAGGVDPDAENTTELDEK